MDMDKYIFLSQNKETHNEILSQYDKNKDKYNKFSSEIKKLIVKLLEDASIPFHTITYRVKKRHSLAEKLIKKNYNNSSEITDICGCRIITYYADDIDPVADIINKEFVIDKDNSVDKIKEIETNAFGYLSKHLIIELNKSRLNLPEYRSYKDLKLEIQIRSVLQHAWAEIEHDLGYKNSSVIDNKLQRRFARLSALLELADQEFQLIKNSATVGSYNLHNKIRLTEEVPITEDSLSSFIKESTLLKELDQNVFLSFDNVVDINDRVVINNIIPELKKVNILTLKNLTDFIIDENKSLHQFFDSYFVNFDAKVTAYKRAGFSLQYIIYYKILHEHDIDTLHKYLNDDENCPPEEIDKKIDWLDEAYDYSQIRTI